MSPERLSNWLLRKDRVDAGSFFGEVCHLGRALDRVGAGEPHAGPIGYLDRRPVDGMRIARSERLDEVGSRRAALASQRRDHEHIVDFKGADAMPHNPTVRHVSSGARCSPETRSVRTVGRPKWLSPSAPSPSPTWQCAHIHRACRQSLAKPPLARGQAVADVDCSRARSVWRSPGRNAAWIGENGVIDRGSR